MFFRRSFESFISNLKTDLTLLFKDNKKKLKNAEIKMNIQRKNFLVKLIKHQFVFQHVITQQAFARDENFKLVEPSNSAIIVFTIPDGSVSKFKNLFPDTVSPDYQQVGDFLSRMLLS